MKSKIKERCLICKDSIGINYYSLTDFDNIVYQNRIMEGINLPKFTFKLRGQTIKKHGTNCLYIACEHCSSKYKSNKIELLEIIELREKTESFRITKINNKRFLTL